MILVVPLTLFALLLFTIPVTVVETSTGAARSAPRPSLIVTVVALIFVVIVLVVILLSIVASVVLPIALYFDARAVAQAAVGWEPDPVIYGLLGLAPYLTTPLVGIIVAIYYLFRRREHVGVP